MRGVICLQIAWVLAGCVGTVGTDADLELHADDELDSGDPGPVVTDPGPGDTSPGDGVGDGGDATAGDGDGAGDDGPPPCTALLCEDFESYMMGSAPGAPWSASTNQGAVAVDGEHAVSGTRAVKFTTADGAGTYRRAYMGLAAPYFPIAGNHFFGRMMVWLTEAPVASVHWTNIQGEGPVAGQDYRSLYRYGGQTDKHIMANYETSGRSTDCWQHSSTVMPEKRWACIEWEFDGTADTMRYWLDGTALTAITVIDQGSGCIGHDLADKWIAPVFDKLYLGWEHYQQVSAREMWIDDVAIDTSRVGCPP